VRGVGGDYYDYIPINGHTIQVVIADVAGKGVPAALLMAATAAAVQLEVSEKRGILDVVNRLTTGSILYLTATVTSHLCWRTLMHSADLSGTSTAATIRRSFFRQKRVTSSP